MLEIAEQEDFTLDEDAAAFIARLADGGMRDALSLLDQCAAFSHHIDREVVAQTAGIAGSGHLFALSDAIAAQDAAAALTLLGQLYDNAKGMERLVTELIGHYRSVMLCKSTSDPQSLITCLPDELERYQEMAKNLSLPRILEILGVFQRCLDSLSRSGDQKVEVEMALIRLCCGAQLQAVQTAAAPALQAAAPSPAPAAPVSPAPKTEPKAEPVPAGNGPVPMAQWPDLLDEMSRSEPALYVMLEGSNAFVSNGVVLIESPNPMLKSLLLTNNIGAKLADMGEQTLGSRHTLRIANRCS